MRDEVKLAPGALAAGETRITEGGATICRVSRRGRRHDRWGTCRQRVKQAARQTCGHDGVRVDGVGRARGVRQTRRRAEGGLRTVVGLTGGCGGGGSGASGVCIGSLFLVAGGNVGVVRLGVGAADMDFLRAG